MLWFLVKRNLVCQNGHKYASDVTFVSFAVLRSGQGKGGRKKGEGSIALTFTLTCSTSCLSDMHDGGRGGGLAYFSRFVLGCSLYGYHFSFPPQISSSAFFFFLFLSLFLFFFFFCSVSLVTLLRHEHDLYMDTDRSAGKIKVSSSSIASL